MIVLTNSKGIEIRRLNYDFFDFDMNDTKNFAIEMPASEFKKDLASGARVFVPGTEYGGIIGGLETYGASGTVRITGRTWRGILDKKIIEPFKGQDYRTVNGDINAVFSILINEYKLEQLFDVLLSEGISVNYQFDRYCTLYEGITKMCNKYGYKPVLRYKQGENGAPGYVELSAQPIVNLSDKVSMSENGGVYFNIESRQDQTNHLIALGSGELKDRMIVHLYLWPDKSVKQTPYYTGLNDVSETYDYPNVSSKAELIEQGTAKLIELSNYQNLSMDIYAIDEEVMIGDIVGGRDYITGVKLEQPIINVVYKEQNGQTSTQYVIEGDVTGSYDIDIQEDSTDEGDIEGYSLSFAGEILDDFQRNTEAVYRCRNYDDDFNISNTYVAFSWYGITLKDRVVGTDAYGMPIVDFIFDISTDAEIGTMKLIFSDGYNRKTMEVEVIE